MRALKWILLMLPIYANAVEPKEQKFNEYSNDFRVDSVNFSYYAISFSGAVKSTGEIVFEMVHDDGYENEIYKIVFIPEDASIFPAISEGFYPKELDKIGLLNLSEVKALLFSDEEWEAAISQKPRYISLRASLVLEQYGTSVECDTRQYYANISSVSKDNIKLAYHAVRPDVAGC